MILLSVVMVTVFLLSLFVGRYPEPGLIAPGRLLKDQLAFKLVLSLRLPRVLTALMLGMVLSCAGSVFQMIFANPLVEPGLLGVSQGAAFGAALGILFLNNVGWVVQALAAIFAVLGLGFSYFLAHKLRFGGWLLRLILSGIAVSAFFSAGIGILKFVADPLSELPEITFWLLGGLYGITWTEVRYVFPVVAAGLFILYRMRWRLNVLSLNDMTAFSLGIFPERERLFLLVCATGITAAVVSVSGIVAWVGLIVPHVSRRLLGADSRYSVPASLLLGGSFAIICDDVSRTVLPGEIPIGILTSLIGAVLFVIILSKPYVRLK